MARGILFLLLALVTGMASAQSIQRNAMLGISMRQVPDSLHQASGEVIKGVYAEKVFPSTTADALGVKAGDILLTVNGKAARDPNETAAQIRELKVGDPISLSWLRQGRPMKKNGRMLPKPLETSNLADVKYGEVVYEGTALRSITMVPKGVVKPPVVFMIQGYTCGSTEFPLDQDLVLRKIIDDFLAAGFAVYRTEKPGVGDGYTDTPCHTTDFNVELKAFREGFRALRERKDIDRERIILFGHSMGGVVAPLVAAEYQPLGVITYGTVIKSWYEYMIDLTRIQTERFGGSFDSVETSTRMAIRFYYDMLINKHSSEQLIAEHPGFVKRENALESLQNNQYIGRHLSFWQSLQDLNLSKAWMDYDGNVLAMYGELDIQALNEEHVKLIKRTVNSAKPGEASYVIIPHADHVFVHFDSITEQMRVLDSGDYGEYLRASYHTGVAEEAIRWMKGII